jgi:hypothetical protein
MTREEQTIQAAKDFLPHITNAQLTLFAAGVMWADKHQNLWHDAQGDDLPEIDREVIVLTQSYPLEKGEYAVSFAHRPYKKGYLGKSLVTGNIETFYPHTYGKGGWNIPDVKWWLDCSLPNMEEQQ